MTTSFYKQIVDSFHFNEKKDFEAICSILDKKVYEKENVTVISDDPYLLVLIFLCLTRHDGIKIHILNPKEGLKEIERLVSIINPDLVISTSKDIFKLKDSGYVWMWKSIWIDGEIISKQPRYDVSDIENDTDFTVVTYTPYPTKVHTTSSELFSAMLNALISDLYKFDLISDHDYGCIPFTSDNPDYLLYLVSLRLASVTMTLPSKDDVDLPINHKDVYKLHNKAKTLFIPKKEFVDMWQKHISTIFEKPFIFRFYLKWVWVVNLLIDRRLKRLLRGFSNVVVIGILDNVYMIDLLKNQSVKFYSIFPMSSAMQFGTISKSLTTITPVGNESQMVRFVPHKERYTITYRLFTDNKDVHLLVNNNLVFKQSTVHIDNQNKHQYEVIGREENAFVNKGAYIFPESLEKVINSNPLIRDCALLTFNKKVTLVIHPNMDILDSVRINQGMFHRIIQQQIDTLNEKLPDEYQIRGFVIGTSLIEKDRLGDIVRHPFNTINKM